jgi:IS5 family transposase
MRPRERRNSGHSDQFKARLGQIADLDYPLAKLGRTVNWRFLEEQLGDSDGSGHPRSPTRLRAHAPNSP